MAAKDNCRGYTDAARLKYEQLEAGLDQTNELEQDNQIQNQAMEHSYHQDTTNGIS